MRREMSRPGLLNANKSARHQEEYWENVEENVQSSLSFLANGFRGCVVQPNRRQQIVLRLRHTNNIISWWIFMEAGRHIFPISNFRLANNSQEINQQGWEKNRDLLCYFTDTWYSFARWAGFFRLRLLQIINSSYSIWEELSLSRPDNKMQFSSPFTRMQE